MDPVAQAQCTQTFKKMAALIRVKRRLDEDPAEGLIVQYYKRRRTDSVQADETEHTEQLCLSLVTTVKSKDAAISRHVAKALRRQQLQTSYKAHDSQRALQTRAEKKAAVKAHRYRIVNSNRALPVDSADTLSSHSDSEGEHSAEGSSAQLKERLGQATESASKSKSKSKSKNNGGALDRVSGLGSEAVTSSSSNTDASEASPSSSDGSVEASSGAAWDGTGDPAIHVYDVEQDSSAASHSQPSTSPGAGSGITLNGESLFSEQVSAAAESGYVYDLYFINNDSLRYDFRDLENILSIEAQHDDLVYENDRQEDCNNVYDDDDDSNDEGNWRNDYPDEDPDRTDEEQRELGYSFDHDALLIERPQFFQCRDDDDFLADALGTRLHLFGDSSSSDNDADDDGDSGNQQGRGSYYDAYMRRAAQDLKLNAEDSD